MRTPRGIGLIVSSVAVAAVGAVGVWMGLAATAVPTVDLGDTTNDVLVASTGTENAVVDVEWRLSPDGDVTVWADLGFDPLSETLNAERGTVIVELWCDARLQIDGMDAGDPDRPIEVIEDGEERLCADGALEEGVPARQIFVLTLEQFDPQSFGGTPVKAWSAETSGQRSARSPRLVLGVGAIVDEALPVMPVTPAHASLLTAVLEATPRELIDVSVTPAGDIDEAMSVSVQSDGERLWTDSVTWQLTFAGLSSLSALEEGLVRWTDPGGQTFTQLLLLLSGALIGVAASLVVERLFAWVVARSAAQPPVVERAERDEAL